MPTPLWSSQSQQPQELSTGARSATGDVSSVHGFKASSLLSAYDPQKCSSGSDTSAATACFGSFVAEQTPTSVSIASLWLFIPGFKASGPWLFRQTGDPKLNKTLPKCAGLGTAIVPGRIGDAWLFPGEVRGRGWYFGLGCGLSSAFQTSGGRHNRGG